MKNLIKFITGSLLVATIFLGCKKNDTTLSPVETYKLIGRIDASRTTIATAAITKAELTISYNNSNSFGDAQSLLNGTLSLTGYTGVSGKDTLSFFATQSSGPAISYITVANTATGITTTTNLYNYFNGAAAVFNATNFPFSNDITSLLKDGNGYFRIGQFPKYIFIVFDNVTKL